ncbi:hypothetical protein BH09PLA1_BH09PLA1_02860 [soil metagenome]
MTVTPKKLAANRANARKSTGPRTRGGKRRSSMNGLRHGFYARKLLLHRHDLRKFARMRRHLMLALRPRTLTELRLCDRIVRANWRLKRLHLLADEHHSPERIGRYAQRLELMMHRGLQLLEKLRRQSQKPKRDDSAEDASWPTVADGRASGESGKSHQIERTEAKDTKQEKEEEDEYEEEED